MGTEKSKPRVNLIVVETIYTPNATISIYQANARCLEDIEGAVVDLREMGIVLSTPGTMGPAERPFFNHEVMQTEGNRDLPVVVYLAGPAHIQRPDDFSSS